MPTTPKTNIDLNNITRFDAEFIFLYSQLKGSIFSLNLKVNIQLSIVAANITTKCIITLGPKININPILINTNIGTTNL
jgi:hypothetical protein